LVAFDLLDADIEAIFGFEGRGPVNLALQRGEIDIDYQTTSAYGPAVEKIAEDGTAVPLMAFGQLDESGDVVRDPNFPDIPTVPEVYQELNGEAPSGAEFEAYKTLLGLTYTYQKAMWVPLDTPPEAVATLRESAEALGNSAEFQEAAAEVLGGYPLLADEELAQSIKAAYTVDSDVRRYVVDLLHTDYQVDLD
jgi:tripartite-type tricarboxylate transporter receptor subunit TctC